MRANEGEIIHGASVAAASPLARAMAYLRILFCMSNAKRRGRVERETVGLNFLTAIDAIAVFAIIQTLQSRVKHCTCR